VVGLLALAQTAAQAALVAITERAAEVAVQATPLVVTLVVSVALVPLAS
jgi:hypothetical protein